MLVNIFFYINSSLSCSWRRNHTISLQNIIYQIVYMYLQVCVGKWLKYHQLVDVARLLIAEIPSTFYVCVQVKVKLNELN